MNLKRVKLTSRVYECVFIRCIINNKAYKFYDLNSKVIIKSNDVELYEDKFSFKLGNGGGTESNHIHVIRSTESNDEVEKEFWRSKSVKTAKYYGSDYAASTMEKYPTNI